MFGKFQDTLKSLQLAHKLMTDKNIKALFSHPKVQTLLQDPEFRAFLQSQLVSKFQRFSELMQHPKMAALMHDPELASLIAKINPETFRSA